MPPPKKAAKRKPTANERAHASLAETRVIDRYLRAIELEEQAKALRADLPELERQFTKVAKRYATRKGIQRESFLDVGVSESVLRKANL